MLAITIIISIVALIIIGFLIFKLKDSNRYASNLKYELNHEQKKNQQLLIKISNTKCLICGNESNGKHYCSSCYDKYKDRAFDARITNCTSLKITDPYGNKNYICDDGRVVRSRAEREISNYFFKNKIRYIYEKPIYYTEYGENKVLHPDFYLPDYELYIEYNELTDSDYLKSKGYAMHIYKQKGLKVITMNNVYNIPAFLNPKLNII